MPELVKAFLIGSISGTISTVLFQPLEVIKTQSQKSGHRGKDVNVLHLLRSIKDKEHVLGFWRGLTPSLLRAVPGVGLYFVNIQFFKQVVGLDTPNSLKTLAVGATARSVCCICLIPLTVIKTRFESGEYPYRNIRHAVYSIYRTEGLLGFTRGLLPTILRDVPFSALYLVLYDYMKRITTEDTSRTDHKNTRKIYYTESVRIFTCGVFAGCLASSITHPSDVIKTKMQLYPEKFQTIFSGLSFIHKTYGVKGFFKGLSPRLLRRTLITAMTWTLYERIAISLNLR